MITQAKLQIIVLFCNHPIIRKLWITFSPIILVLKNIFMFGFDFQCQTPNLNKALSCYLVVDHNLWLTQSLRNLTSFFVAPNAMCTAHVHCKLCNCTYLHKRCASPFWTTLLLCEGPTIRKNFHLSTNGKQILISAYILRFTNPSQQYHKTNHICWDITRFIFHLPFISRSTKWHYTNNRRKWGAAIKILK